MKACGPRPYLFNSTPRKWAGHGRKVMRADGGGFDFREFVGQPLNFYLLSLYLTGKATPEQLKQLIKNLSQSGTEKTPEILTIVGKETLRLLLHDWRRRTQNVGLIFAHIYQIQGVYKYQVWKNVSFYKIFDKVNQSRNKADYLLRQLANPEVTDEALVKEWSDWQPHVEGIYKTLEQLEASVRGLTYPYKEWKQKYTALLAEPGVLKLQAQQTKRRR